MSNQLSTKIATIDFKKIAANALKRKRWGDKWVLFDGYGVYLVMNVTSINVSNNSINMNLRLDINEYDDDYELILRDTYKSTTLSFNMDPEHYNAEALINSVKGSVRRLIKSSYMEFAAETPEYKVAVAKDKAVSEAAREAAIDELDRLEISAEAIREAYIEAEVDDANTYDARYDCQNEYRLDHLDSLTKLVVGSLKFAEDIL